MSTDEWDTNSPGAVLTRIETKLDKSLSEIADHEARIRRVEQLIWKAVGAAAVLSAAGAAGASRLFGG